MHCEQPDPDRARTVHDRWRDAVRRKREIGALRERSVRVGLGKPTRDVGELQLDSNEPLEGVLRRHTRTQLAVAHNEHLMFEQWAQRAACEFRIVAAVPLPHLDLAPCATAELQYGQLERLEDRARLTTAVAERRTSSDAANEVGDAESDRHLAPYA